ncbi:hypothetical protein [Natrialba magadii]|nr:hypothetical protein [Natrialba magadii]
MNSRGHDRTTGRAGERANGRVEQTGERANGRVEQTGERTSRADGVRR